MKVKKISELELGEPFFYGIHDDSNGDFEYRLAVFKKLVSEEELYKDGGEKWTVWSDNRIGSTNITTYPDQDSMVEVPSYPSVLYAFAMFEEAKEGKHKMDRHEFKKLTAFVEWHS